MKKLIWLCLCIPLSALAEPLEIWISSYQDQVYYEKMVALYQNQVDKEFQANITAFGFREMPDKLAASIKAGKRGPDIVQLDEILFGVFLSRTIPFVDLTERVKKAKLDQAILKPRLDLFSYQKKVYGLSQSLGAVVLYYRRDQFAEHGIGEEDLATWDGLVATGKKLAEKGQKLIAIDPSYFGILLRQRGYNLFNEKGEPFPQMDKAVETLAFIKKLQDDGIAQMPDRGSIFDPVFFGGDIENNEVLCVIGADWYGLDMIQQFAAHQKGLWRAMPLPAWNEKGKLSRRTSTFAGQGLLIYKGSKLIDPSWNFLKFIMSDKEANAQRFLLGNSMPAFKPAYEDKRLMAKQPFFEQSLGKLFIKLSKSIPSVAMTPKRPQAVFMLQENYFSSVMYGNITPQKAIEEMKAALSK